MCRVPSCIITLTRSQWFDAKNITPRFEFGFGLSYTTFKFGSLSLAKTFKADSTSVQPTAEPFAKLSDSGSSLYDILYTVRHSSASAAAYRSLHSFV
jgi:beta-glucosidase